MLLPRDAVTSFFFFFSTGFSIYDQAFDGVSFFVLLSLFVLVFFSWPSNLQSDSFGGVMVKAEKGISGARGLWFPALNGFVQFKLSAGGSENGCSGGFLQTRHRVGATVGAKNLGT